MPEEQGPCALFQDNVDAKTVIRQQKLDAVDTAINAFAIVAAINAFAIADAELMAAQIDLQSCIADNGLNQNANPPMAMATHSDKVTEASVRLKFEHVFEKKHDKK